MWEDETALLEENNFGRRIMAATIEKLAEQNAMHPEYQAQIAHLQGAHVVLALKLGDAEKTIASMLKRQLNLTSALGALSELVRACSGLDDPKIAAALFVAEAILDINRKPVADRRESL